jgi:hypothetical protein
MIGLAGKLMAKPYGSSVSRISFVSAASAAANTVALPTHAAGDLLILHCFNNNSTDFPTTPSGGWTYLNGLYISANLQASVVFYKIAASSSETLGTSTYATAVSVTVYRGVNTSKPFGKINGTGNTSQAYITYASIAAPTAANSWIVLLAGTSASGSDTLTTPSGTINRTTTIGGSNAITANDSNGPVGTTWAARNASTSAVLFSMSRTLEILSA